MLYTILCYNDEDVVWSWSKEEDAAVMARLGVVQERLTKAGKLGPSLRLLPTTSATTLRKTQDPPLVIDGPFAETKEQLLGFYVIDVANLDEALDVARELAAANPGGAYEIRPVALYCPDRAAPDERRHLDQRGAHRRATAGDRRAAALFPRPRYRRGGVPGSLPARAADTGRATGRRAIRRRG